MSALFKIDFRELLASQCQDEFEFESELRASLHLKLILTLDRATKELKEHLNVFYYGEVPYRLGIHQEKIFTKSFDFDLNEIDELFLLCRSKRGVDDVLRFSKRDQESPEMREVFQRQGPAPRLFSKPVFLGSTFYGFSLVTQKSAREITFYGHDWNKNSFLPAVAVAGAGLYSLQADTDLFGT